MKENFHVDMSGRIYEGKTIGVSIVGAETKIHFGCALKGNLIKLIKKELFKDNIFQDAAKLYAICIYLLLNELDNKINSLVICNDEDFEIVKKSLCKLLNNPKFEIINITEFRKRLGINVGSPADNYARTYRKRALKPTRLAKGKKLNVVPITYTIIKKYWEKI